MDDTIPQNIPTKQCARCGLVKDLSQFYRRSAVPDGYGYTCKMCLAIRRVEIAKLPNEEKPRYRPEIQPFLRCSSCRREKRLSEFYKMDSVSRGYSFSCKQCSKQKKMDRKTLPQGVMRCYQCDKVGGYDDFYVYRGRNGAIGYRQPCKECHSKNSKEDYPQKAHQVRKLHLKSWFDMTMEDYQAMFDTQGGVCKCCGNPETIIDKRTGQPKRLSVDHCHSTGIVRGLLCQACNSAVGFVKESPVRAEAVLNYVQHWHDQKEVSIV